MRGAGRPSVLAQGGVSVASDCNRDPGFGLASGMPTSPTPSWRDARVLVTGAAGFIGRHLVRRLAAQGARVVGASRRAAPGSLGGEWRQVDLADRAAAAALVEDTSPDAVFHLASHVAGSRDLSMVLSTFDANLASTVYLLEALARSRPTCRVVLTGSLEEPEPGDPAAPAFPYAASKAAATGYARMFHQLYGLPVAIARVFMVYGPGPQDDKKLVPYAIRRLLAGEATQFSSGVRPVDWVYVDDVAEGLVRLAHSDAALGQRVDLGRGELFTVREVIERLYALLAPGRQPEFGSLGDRAAEQIRQADTERTRQLLGGWSPPTPLAAGLEKTVDYFRALGAG